MSYRVADSNTPGEENFDPTQLHAIPTVRTQGEITVTAIITGFKEIAEGRPESPSASIAMLWSLCSKIGLLTPNPAGPLCRLFGDLEFSKLPSSIQTGVGEENFNRVQAHFRGMPQYK